MYLFLQKSTFSEEKKTYFFAKRNTNFISTNVLLDGLGWMYMGQFPQDGKNGCFASLFSCPQTAQYVNCHWLTQSVTDFYFCHTKSNSRDLLPLRHLIRVMRRHELTDLTYQIQKIWKKFWKSEVKNLKIWICSKNPKISKNSEKFLKIWNVS